MNLLERILKKGPGRGWWGPPIGTHGAGSQGGGVPASGGGTTAAPVAETDSGEKIYRPAYGERLPDDILHSTGKNAVLLDPDGKLVITSHLHTSNAHADVVASLGDTKRYDQYMRGVMFNDAGSPTGRIVYFMSTGTLSVTRGRSAGDADAALFKKMGRLSRGLTGAGFSSDTLIRWPTAATMSSAEWVIPLSEASLYKEKQASLRFSWDPRVSRYRDIDTGQFVSKAVVDAAVEKSIVNAGPVADNLATLVADGTMSSDAWYTAMRQEIQDEVTRQYGAGRGGIAQMTASDWATIEEIVKDQEYYLKAGPGRGWWGPPIGTHGSGSQGGKIPDGGVAGGMLNEKAAEIVRKRFRVVNKDGSERELTEAQVERYTKMVQKHPPEAWAPDSIAKVYLCTTPQAYRRQETSSGIRPGSSQALYDHRYRSVAIGPSGMKSEVTFHHEVAHAVWAKSGIKGNPTWKKAYRNDKNFDRHTAYSRNAKRFREEEAFAESYAAWIKAGGNSSKLPKNYGPTFAVVQKVVGAKFQSVGGN